MKLISLAFVGLILFTSCKGEFEDTQLKPPSLCSSREDCPRGYIYDVMYLSGDIESDCLKFYYEPNFKGNVTQVCGTVDSFGEFVPQYRSFKASPNSVFALYEKSNFGGRHVYVGKGKSIMEVADTQANDNSIAPYLKSIHLIREDCFYLGLVIDNVEVKREICQDVSQFQLAKYDNSVFFLEGNRFPGNLSNDEEVNFLSDEPNVVFGRPVYVPKRKLVSMPRFNSMRSARIAAGGRPEPGPGAKLLGYARSRPPPYGGGSGAKEVDDDTIIIDDGEVPLMVSDGIQSNQFQRVYAEIPSNRVNVVFFTEPGFKGQSFTGIQGDEIGINLNSIQSMRVNYSYDAQGFLCQYEAGNFGFELIRKGVKEIECLSFNGRECYRMPMDPEECAQFVEKNYARIKPLKCGQDHYRIFGITGYKSLGHWCKLGKRYLG